MDFSEGSFLFQNLVVYEATILLVFPLLVGLFSKGTTSELNHSSSGSDLYLAIPDSNLYWVMH